MIEKQNWFLIGQVLQRLINKNCIFNDELCEDIPMRGAASVTTV